ncbi:MAG: hypothetical protein AB9834_12680 [Lentimicrobium sp.]
MKAKFDELLTSLERDIEYSTSTLLRAETLLRLLKVKKADNKLPNLKKALHSSDNEVNEYNRLVAYGNEIDFAIKILEAFQKDVNFSITPSNRMSKDLSNRYNEIKERLIEIVYKDNPDSSGIFFDII